MGCLLLHDYRNVKDTVPFHRQALPSPILSVGSIGTMARTDFSRQTLFRPTQSLSTPCVRETSPGKSNRLHLIYLPHLRYGVWVVLDFVLSCKLVRPKYALYVISVRQTETLPPASSRFHLAVDTLAFS